MEEGLPNIIGTFKAIGENSANSSDKYASGAFSATAINEAYRSNSGNDVKTWSFKASNSNTIYGNSNKVQPSALTVRHYIKF